MLSKAVIDQLYRTYPRRVDSPDELDIAVLFEELIDFHDVGIDEEGNLVLGTVEETSPFRSIPLRNIHAIVNFEDEVAIVLPASIIILDKSCPQVYVNLRAPASGIKGWVQRLMP